MEAGCDEEVGIIYTDNRRVRGKPCNDRIDSANS